MLFLVSALALLYANRTLLVDGRTSRYQVQTRQAFEAAEAGVEWTTALLNDPHRLDDTCHATPLASAVSLRDRLLDFDEATGRYQPKTWLDSGVARFLQAACASTGSGWQCSCPSSGPPQSPAGAISGPAFLVSLQAGDRAGTVQVTATGCSNRAPECVTGSGEPLEARAQVQTLLALLPALFAAPAAPLTARGDVVAPGASIGLVNTDPASGGTTVDAGGDFIAAGARLTSAAGAVSSLSAIEGDSALAMLATDRLFARHFGMDKPTWKQRPGVVRIACAAECAPQVGAALSADSSLLWIDGDLATSGTATWGTPDRPVIVVASGDIRLTGAITVYGVLYGRGIAWDDATPGSAGLHGAAISEADYHGTGSPDLVYDTTILRTLNRRTGDLVRVPGSWRDF